MNRRLRSFVSLALCVLTLASGCQPTQPFFFSEDGTLLGPGDLSHYKDLATEIDYPDVHTQTLDEVYGTQPPLTLANSENFDMWDLTLEEVTRITLANSQVIRQLGGRIADNGANISATTPETLQQNPTAVTTTYDPALVESGDGTSSGSPYDGTGVEAALSEFDAQLDTSVTWQKNDRPQNFGFNDPNSPIQNFFAPLFQQDLGNFTAGITKIAADGTTFEIRNNTNYDQNNNGSRIQPSDWFTNFEASFTRPFLQGAGTQYNRIAGPLTFQQAASGFPNQIDGVIIARIRQDITLTDFEAAVRNLMRDVEDAYWELQFAYRDLEARKIGRDSALETWRKVKALKRVSTTGGEADKEAQARSQYFLFRSQVETALTSLFRVENRLRYLMGLTPSDHRLIRPIDEPTTALVKFDWPAIQSESLVRRTELRRQKWQVKRRELELIAARNNMLPRLDAVGRYRWVGAGNDLIDNQPNGAPPFQDGSNAFEVLTGGDFQEWEIGLQMTLPIGFRRALTGVRHYQLLLARERAVLQDLELEVTHQLGDAVRDLDLNYGLTQTYFNRRVAAEDEVEAVEAVLDSGRVTLDLLLDAQRRRAEAESLYYRALVDYNRAIMRVHYRKGSLLEYNGVYLAEGPWPAKAYFDALRRARRRDASTYLDYGFTRPNVISCGPYDQFSGQGELVMPPEPTPADDGSTEEPMTPTEVNPNEEIIPLPNDSTSQARPGLEITPDDLAKLPAIDPASAGVELATHTAPSAGENPFRQSIQKWSDPSLQQLPADRRPLAGPQPSVTPESIPTTGPAGQPLNDIDESVSNHTSVGTVANPAIGEGAKR
jgi:outer membrane protein TolC